MIGKDGKLKQMKEKSLNPMKGKNKQKDSMYSTLKVKSI